MKYLKGTRDMGITFTTMPQTSIASYVKFPIDPNTKLYSMTDANWGPQDQSISKIPNPPNQLDLFKSRSISGYIQWYGGPLHWSSKRQSITARSTTKAEIYATDEYVKHLLYLSHLLEDIDLINTVMPDPMVVLNDNNACMQWSHNNTTKGLRHVQI